MLTTVKGIVVSETPFKESSKILNIYTKEFGIIGVMSKGCRNIKSKLRGVSRKLIYGTFNIYHKDKGLSTLISVDVKSSFSNILSDLERVSYASFMLDLVLQVVRQTEDSSIFGLLKDSLLKLEEGFSGVVLTNILELKVLDYLGVTPSIDACSICGSDKAIVTLSSDDGGYVCKNCYSNQVMVSDKTIKMIRLYYYVDLSKITKLEVSNEVTKEINDFLDRYYERYTGLYLKSKDFMKQIEKLSSIKEG